MKTLITGVAGFTGAKAAEMLLEAGHEAIGIDNLNDYYDPSLKRDRLRHFTSNKSHRFVEANIKDLDAIIDLMQKQKLDNIIHLAAQAGVCYSNDNPHAYLISNLVGTFEILEAVRARAPNTCSWPTHLQPMATIWTCFIRKYTKLTIKCRFTQQQKRQMSQLRIPMRIYIM